MQFAGQPENFKPLVGQCYFLLIIVFIPSDGVI